MALHYSARAFGGVGLKFLSIIRAPANRGIAVSATNYSVVEHPKVAVVLSGCGVYDGSEIHEASAVLMHLTRAGATPLIYAPDIPQMHVINHSQGAPSEGEKRNVLVEAARIARGQVEPLSSLTSRCADAVVFPGGFGAAKNLSDFATQGKDCRVIPDVERVIKDFAAHKKPMGFCCIAPVLVARVLKGVNVTLGQLDSGDGQWPYGGAIDAVKAWGASHTPLDVHGVCTDSTHRIVTTPAFMYDTRQFHLVYDGIGNMIGELMRLV